MLHQLLPGPRPSLRDIRQARGPVAWARRPGGRQFAKKPKRSPAHNCESCHHVLPMPARLPLQRAMADATAAHAAYDFRAGTITAPTSRNRPVPAPAMRKTFCVLSSVVPMCSHTAFLTCLSELLLYRLCHSPPPPLCALCMCRVWCALCALCMIYVLCVACVCIVACCVPCVPCVLCAVCVCVWGVSPGCCVCVVFLCTTQANCCNYLPLLPTAIPTEANGSTRRATDRLQLVELMQLSTDSRICN